MVYVRQVKLSCFKSFGGSVEIPLNPGFTVITGPNGSGKSNIIDGILFCLGLASSRGMRAERLPDLINHRIVRQGRAAEASVSVTFSLADWQPPDVESDTIEVAGPWIAPTQQDVTISRRIRVAPGGTYSSIYSIGAESCSLSQLQVQLRRLRIDPTGSNVVMQGDVTRIVSMGSRERREIIDELAGVALFDQRIEQCRAKLTDVREHEERCHIVEVELQNSRQRLERDCEKARRYQQLRHELRQSRQQELVLLWETSCRQREDLVVRQVRNQHEQQVLHAKRERLTEEHHQKVEQLQEIQRQVKALGEDHLLSVQAELAGLQSRERELQRSLQNQDQAGIEQRQHDWRSRCRQVQAAVEALAGANHTAQLEDVETRCADTGRAVEQQRQRLRELADRSGSWLQTYQQRQQAMAALHASIQPLRTEQLQLQERLKQEEQQLKDWREQQQQAETSHRQDQARLDDLAARKAQLHQTLEALQTACNDGNSTLKLLQRSRQRLERDQVKLEQDLAKLESRREALQESRGTAALRLILESGLPGIHGPVARLGEVEPPHRLALEIAAGARLNHVVVDDDQIAAQAIALLKRHRAGRLTFLPLNRLRAPAPQAALARGSLQYQGLVDRAVALVRFEPIYGQVFAHVLGETLVFETLNQARRLLGQHRCVTLDGDLLERSGAMTGGSLQRRQDRLSFSGSEQADEAEPLRQRLLELGHHLSACRREEAKQGQAIDALQTQLTDASCRLAAVDAEHGSGLAQHQTLAGTIHQQRQRITASAARMAEGQTRLQALEEQLAAQQSQLVRLEVPAEDGEATMVSGQWHQLQEELKAAEAQHTANQAQRESLRSALREHQLNSQRLADQRQLLTQEGNQLERERQALNQRRQELTADQQQLEMERQGLQAQLQELQQALGQRRRQRDQLEAAVGQLNQKIHESTWQQQQLEEKQQALKDQQTAMEEQIRLQQAELPDPRPQLSDGLRAAGLEALQQHIHKLEQCLQALEPVNMLALEELAELETRQAAIAERLTVLQDEREGLLQRIETMAGLRKEAFMEAFTAVNGHFRQIFTQLSDGEGHLQLEDEADPLSGGLTLVAHPKGKVMRRLNAMSGGEKSLTALSLLFALQRFRPSPFYALDEVDSFLDGVNVENLARLIAQQAQQAQFLVVSHRRPMIAASHRTIGVTQSRGAHTQVIGLPTQAG
ncbi:MAG: chromosome partitioning protein ParA [Candidatus Synechococcus spongiarum 142]|uniref:Chromosome partition protein Smc n=1 Tax=Candidatus Synechococcus spongiarum 142 TaxID=1608213 RepID=A0A6N3X427_9SYNE|nr:MAG: chromosome partitioning protein ParA [Candidatus Synechococcus spongiarum 142]